MQTVRRSGGPSVSDTSVDINGFQRCTRKLVRRISTELRMPRKKLHNVAQRCTKLRNVAQTPIRLHTYKLQLVQELQPNDRTKRDAFTTTSYSH